jgi:hypothetical protein
MKNLLIMTFFLVAQAAAGMPATSGDDQISGGVPASESTARTVSGVGPQYTDVGGNLWFTGTGSWALNNETRKATITSIGIQNKAAVASGSIMIFMMAADQPGTSATNLQGIALWNGNGVPANSTNNYSGTATFEVISDGEYYVDFSVWEYEGRLSDPMCVNGYCLDSVITLTQKIRVTDGKYYLVASTPPTTITPQTGLWWNPAESGSGYALDYKHGVLVVTTYSYKVTGESEWYISSGPVVSNIFTGRLDKFHHGQCISCPYPGNPISGGSDGTMTISFTSPTSATLYLPGRSPVNIVPEAF